VQLVKEQLEAVEANWSARKIGQYKASAEARYETRINVRFKAQFTEDFGYTHSERWL
jgi:hypothetical protein